MTAKRLSWMKSIFSQRIDVSVSAERPDNPTAYLWFEVGVSVVCGTSTHDIGTESI